MRNILLAWSGGADSTHRLLRLLLDTTDRVHAHHIRLVNREHRWEAEDKAIAAALPLLQQIRHFDYSESAIDDYRLTHIPFDMANVMLQLGKKVREFYSQPLLQPFTHFTIGTCAEEGHNWDRWPHMLAIMNGVLWAKQNPIAAPVFELPKFYTKKQEVEDLMAYGIPFWSCRRPVNGRACGVCHVCKTLK